MSQELIYTSTTKGLKLGSRGFCTVASTSGMAKNLADRLEALSGYKHLFSTGDPQAKLNPVNTSYLRFKLGGRVYYVLSRIADAGLDYTQRTNKLAHHVVLSREELAIAGPAWVASQGGFFQTIWEGEARILPSDRPIPQGDLQIGVCHAWARIVGDAGWAGVLAESILKRSSTEAYLVCKPGTDVLALFLEAQALLPPDKRWEATFSTYFTKVPPGVECRWRCAIDGTPEAVRARRSPEKLVIDLTAPLPAAEGGRLVVAARSGVLPELDEIETIQPVGGEVQQKTPALPPSVPPAEMNLKVGPPVLPRQKEAEFRSAGHTVEEQSIWKVVIPAVLLLSVLIVSVVWWAFFSTQTTERPVAEHDHIPIEDPAQDHDGVPIDEIETGSDTTPKMNEVDESEVNNDSNVVTNIDPLNKDNDNTQNALETHERKEEINSNGNQDLAGHRQQFTFDRNASFPPLPDLPKGVTVLGADGWNKKVPLGTLSSIDTQMRAQFLGAGSRDIDVKQPNENKMSWQLQIKKKNVATLAIDEQEDPGKEGQLYFKWEKGIVGDRKTEGAIRSGVILLYSNLSTLSKSRLYVPLFFKDSEPRPWSVKVLRNRTMQKRPEIVVLCPETVVLYYRIVSRTIPEINAKGKLDVKDGGLAAVYFGPKDLGELRMQFSRDSHKKLMISTSLQYTKDHKEIVYLLDWYEDRYQERQLRIQDLKDFLVNSVIDNPNTWSSLENQFDLPIYFRKNVDDVGVKISDPTLIPPSKQDLQAWLRNRTDLSKIAQQIPNGNQSIEYESLKKHRSLYPNLSKWKDLLDGLEKPIAIHYRIAIQFDDKISGNSEPYEIDVYSAGTPDLK